MSEKKYSINLTDEQWGYILDAWDGIEDRTIPDEILKQEKQLKKRKRVVDKEKMNLKKQNRDLQKQNELLKQQIDKQHDEQQEIKTKLNEILALH